MNDRERTAVFSELCNRAHNPRVQLRNIITPAA